MGVFVKNLLSVLAYEIQGALADRCTLSRVSTLNIVSEILGYREHRHAVAVRDLSALPAIHRETSDGCLYPQRLAAALAPRVAAVGARPLDDSEIQALAARLLVRHDYEIVQRTGIAHELDAVVETLPADEQCLVVLLGSEARVCAALRYAARRLGEQNGSGHGVMSVGHEAHGGLPSAIASPSTRNFYWPRNSLLDATKWHGTDRSLTLAPWPLYEQAGIDLSAQIAQAHLRYRAPLVVWGVIGTESDAQRVLATWTYGERWQDERWIAC